MWLVPQSMRSHFAAESGCSMKELPSHLSTSDFRTLPRPMQNGKVIQPNSSSRLWKQAHWFRHLYGAAILPISTGKRFVEWWTRSLRDTLAKRGARQVSVWDLPISGGSGATLNTALASFDRASSSWKTCAGSLVAEASALRLKDFPASGMTRNGLLCMRPPLEQVINGIVSLSLGTWPTIVACGNKGANSYANGSLTLQGAAKQHAVGLWPTVLASEGPATLQHDNNPTLAFAVKAWTTPTASFTEPASGMTFNLDLLPMQAVKWNIAQAREHSLKTKVRNPKDPVQVSLLTGEKNSSLLPDKTTLDGIKLSTRDLISNQLLNPNFTDWLMGWPVRWTSASAASDAAVTESWRRRQRSLISTLCTGLE